MIELEEMGKIVKRKSAVRVACQGALESSFVRVTKIRKALELKNVARHMADRTRYYTPFIPVEYCNRLGRDERNAMICTRDRLRETAISVRWRDSLYRRASQNLDILNAFRDTRFGRLLPGDVQENIFDHVLPRDQRQFFTSKCSNLEAEARAKAGNEIKKMTSGWFSLCKVMLKTNVKGTLHFFLQMLTGRSMIKERGKMYMF